MLLHGQREIDPALHRGVVADDHHLAAGDPADAGDQARAGRLAVIEAEGRELAHLEERRAGIDEAHDPVARQELAAAHMAFAAVLRTAERRLGRTAPQLGDQRTVQLGVDGKGRRCGVDGALEFPHGVASPDTGEVAQDALASRVDGGSPKETGLFPPLSAGLRPSPTFPPYRGKALRLDVKTIGSLEVMRSFPSPGPILQSSPRAWRIFAPFR